MNVAKEKVVTIDYELKSAEGEIYDSSDENGALSYIHGIGFLVPGLEKLLEGKTIGDAVEASLTPEEAYGEYDEELVFDVDKSDFEAGVELHEGLEFQAEVAGEVRLCTIVEIEGETVTVDANHPLSGESLQVRAKILAVREATAEELDHGHVHDGSEEHHH
jgi:FKBP-type peptidyl-prolyl cis-trans isomerase SlyD